MEMQYFVSPKEAPATYKEWKNERMAYYDKLGIKKKNCAGNNMRIWSFTQKTPGIFNMNIHSDGMNWRSSLSRRL